MQFLSQEDKDEAISLFKTRVNAYAKQPVDNLVKLEPDTDQENDLPALPELPQLPSVSGVGEPPLKKVKVEAADWLSDIIFIKEEVSETSSLDLEVTRYISELGGPNNALEWWKERAVSYPHIANLAKKYLSIPATSVPSERIFSLAGNLVTRKRALLSPENVDLLIFLKKNKNA